jgi:hypothetical protein
LYNEDESLLCGTLENVGKVFLKDRLVKHNPSIFRTIPELQPTANNEYHLR